MWLSPSEVKEVKGIDAFGKKVDCTQRNQCNWYAEDIFCAKTKGRRTSFLQKQEDPASKFQCAKRTTEFWPAFKERMEEGSNPLWTRIQEGLKLYNIDPQCVRAFTKFTLGVFRQRTAFYAKVRRESHECYAFPVGDCAFTVSFRAGRGLNTGLKGALSVATCLTEAIAKESGRLVDADFMEHSSFMSGLQDREVRVRSIEMMRINDVPVVEQTQKSLDDHTADDEHLRSVLKDRFRQIARGVFRTGRLPDTIAPADEKKLFEIVDKASPEMVRVFAFGEAWNTGAVGGREIVPRTLYTKDNSEVESFSTKEAPEADLSCSACSKNGGNWEPTPLCSSQALATDTEKLAMPSLFRTVSC